MLCYGECVMDMSSVEVNELYACRMLCVADTLGVEGIQSHTCMR